MCLPLQDIVEQSLRKGEEEGVPAHVSLVANWIEYWSPETRLRVLFDRVSCPPITTTMEAVVLLKYSVEHLSEEGLLHCLRCLRRADVNMQEFMEVVEQLVNPKRVPSVSVCPFAVVCLGPRHPATWLLPPSLVERTGSTSPCLLGNESHYFVKTPCPLCL